MAEGLAKLPTEERLLRLRHSAAHIMAEAVLSVFPNAKLGIGPPIDTGFYYDFDLPRPLTTDDLPIIEDKMRQRIAADVPFVRDEISKVEATRALRYSALQARADRRNRGRSGQPL